MAKEIKKIILIGHRKRQGKDTFALALSKILGAQVLHFADPLKQIVADTFGMTQEELETAKNDPDEYCINHSGWAEAWETEEFPEGDYHSYRLILQRFGDAMKKQFGEDVWARLAAGNIRDSSADVVILPDMRFTTEFLALCREFGPGKIITVNVVRPGTESEDTHGSETELDSFPYNYTIINDGSIDDLRKKANAFCKRHVKIAMDS